MTSKMNGNNKTYWDIAMKFCGTEDGDVDKFKKDLDDRNSSLYQLIFTWNDLVHTGNIKGFDSFKSNFIKFFGLDIPIEENIEKNRFWQKYIDEINEKWDLFIKGIELKNKGDNE